MTVRADAPPDRARSASDGSSDPSLALGARISGADGPTVIQALHDRLHKQHVQHGKDSQ